MIGNDIVDLKEAAKDSNWQRPRFLNKVFTQSEQDYISSSEDQHQIVWLLWSMKEAAYKVNVQQFGKRFFNPKRLVCDLISAKKGLVTFDDENYFTCSEITENYIYTVATLSKDANYKSDFFKLKNSSYKAQSESLKEQLFKVLQIDFLEIKKNSVGVPILFQKEKELNISFSLTHHGLFGAFSIL